MDLEAYQTMRDSAWVRERRAEIERGESSECPVAGCRGRLEPYSLEDPGGAFAGASVPGGVRCPLCGATSRPVVL